MESPQDAPKARGRFKGFMRNLSLSKPLDRRNSSGIKLGRSSSKLALETTTTNTTTTENNGDDQSSIALASPQPPQTPAQAPVAQLATTGDRTRQRTPEPLGDTTELQVNVSLSFEEPLDFSYGRIYEASPAFRASDAMCQALLVRVDHCCQELITRKDPIALDRTNVGDGTGKPLRFEICIDIIRGSESWATRTYKSYQKQALTGDSARDITLSAHQIVGLFMRQHDDGFVWKDGPFSQESQHTPETFPYRPGRVQPLTCVPRSLFLEKPQNFEKIPGYSIQLEVTSNNHLPKPREWNRVIEINSHQETPLDLASAEDLFFETSYAVEGAMHSARKAFAMRHRHCGTSRRCARCRPHDGDGLELKIKVMNNIGPQFEHLSRTIRSQLGGFLVQADAEETIDLLVSLESSCQNLREEFDMAMENRNDLEFSITELRGRGWTLDEPIAFTIGSDKSHARRDTEAILDRVQTGIASVLRGNALKVRMTAYKRGHFIMDKTLVAREPFEGAGPGSAQFMRRARATDKTKAQVVDKMRRQINKDIEMVCRDTCTVIEPEEEVMDIPSRSHEDSESFSLPSDDHVSNSNIGRALDGITPDEIEVNSNSDLPANRHKRANTVGSLLELSVTNHSEPAVATASSKAESISERTNSTLHTDRYRPSITTSRPSTSRHSSRAIRDPDTGGRVFPLAPSSDKYSGVDESLDLHDDVSQRYSTRTPVTATDHSTTPSTPSLVAGDHPSTPSSLLITPRTHENLSDRRSDLGKTVSEAPSVEYRKSTSPLKRQETLSSTTDSAAVLATAASSESLKETSAESPVYQDEQFAQSKPDFDFNTPTPMSPRSEAFEDDDDDGVRKPIVGMGASPQVSSRKSRRDDRQQEQECEVLPRAKTRKRTASGSLELFIDKMKEVNATIPYIIDDTMSKVDDDGLGAVDENEQAVESTPSSPARSSSRPRSSAGLGANSSAATMPRPQHQHRKSLGSAGFLGSFREDRVAGIVGLRGGMMLTPSAAQPSNSGVPPVPPVPQHFGARSLSFDSTKLLALSGGVGAVNGSPRPGTSAGQLRTLSHGGAAAAAYAFDDGVSDDDGIPPVPPLPRQ